MPLGRDAFCFAEDWGKEREGVSQRSLAMVLHTHRSPSCVHLETLGRSKGQASATDMSDRSQFHTVVDVVSCRQVRCQIHCFCPNIEVARFFSSVASAECTEREEPDTLLNLKRSRAVNGLRILIAGASVQAANCR